MRRPRATSVAVQVEGAQRNLAELVHGEISRELGTTAGDTGFFGGERVGDEYIVRAGDAHAWTHVLVPGRGFITVDATPPAFCNQFPIARAAGAAGRAQAASV